MSAASTLIAYIVIRAQMAIFNGTLTFPSKPVSVEECDYSFVLQDSWNMTTPAYVLVPRR